MRQAVLTKSKNYVWKMAVALLLMALALGIFPIRQADAIPDYHRREMLRLEKSYKDILADANGPAQAAAKLQGIADQEQLEKEIVGFAKAVHGLKAFDKAAETFDILIQKQDLPSAILAADILLKIADTVATSSYGLSKELRSFPDELCERSASLMDYPNPLVQAMGEWMISLRVKKQTATTKKLDETFRPGKSKQAWYVKWEQREANFDLEDNYCRQLIQMNRHRTAAGVAEDVEKVAARMSKLLADPKTKKDEAPVAAYETALANAREAASGSNLTQAHIAYIILRKAARDVIVASRYEFPREGVAFYTNPTITGGVWNVNVVVTGRTNIPLGDLYVKKNSDPAKAATALKIEEKIGAGSIRGLDLNWDGDKLLFSYWMQPITGEAPFGWDYTKNASLFTTDLQGSELTRLTNAPGSNDVEPCFLPNGGYIFASDRSSYGNQCAGPFLQNKRCTTLFRLDPSRDKEPVAISNNKDFDRHPHVLNDGTVVFMHWEYQERGLYNLHTAWRCRPDGTNMDALYKQHIDVPMSIRDVQQVPGSDLCVATAQGHHDAHNGPVITFNPALGINNADSMRLITPGTSSVEGGLGPLNNQIVEEGGVENRGGFFINPFPMSEKAFLVGHEMTGNECEYGVYYIDVWGNRELIHRDKNMSCFMPHPLRQREKPPVVADTVNPNINYAMAFLENVYLDLPGVEEGAVKYLRMNQRLFLPAPVDYEDRNYDHNHLHYLPGDSTSYHFGHWTWAPTRTIGMVKVNPDGSAYFKVPAGMPVFLQALDENFCEVRRMRSSFTLQRGEFRGCTGCHESRYEATGRVYRTDTLSAGPATPEPPSWGVNTILDYREHIQPILDKHCVSCHDAEKPAGGIDFTSREIGGFYQSYRSMFGLKPNDPTPVKELNWHFALHPEAKDDEFYGKKKDGTYPDNVRSTKDILEQMEENRFPGMLVSISNRHSKTEITMPYMFGSNKSKLIRTLLDDKKHREKVKSKMTEDEWIRLVTWVDHNAIYHSTVIDVSQYNDNKRLPRVPYYLPSPWQPADTNPTFYNTKDVSKTPVIPEHAKADRKPE
ncbi:MAG: hypothetical protein ACLFUS_08595 [Candidatus Sumerlaeia bacterium]